jgi:hypothetical protein
MKPVLSCVLLLCASLATAAPEVSQHGWQDSQGLRDKISRQPGLGKLLAERHPAIWAAAEDRPGHYLRVALKLTEPCVVGPGAFRIVTAPGDTLDCTGVIVLIGNPEEGRMADARERALRVGPQHAYKGVVKLFVRFTKRGTIRSIIYKET